MAQENASIRFVKDKYEKVFFPVTHQRAVVDSDGMNLETALAGKQNALVSGISIKTINGSSILGSGNIEVQTSISTVNVSVDSNTGTPSATASVTGDTMSISFSNLKGGKGDTGATPEFSVGTVSTLPEGSQATVSITGTTDSPVLNIGIPTGATGAQGNTGSSVDYPYELVNNVTTNDATKGLSAAQGKVLDEKISQLGLKVFDDELTFTPEWARPGKYLGTTGVIYPSSAWSISAPFVLAKGLSINVRTEGSGATIIAETTDGTSYTPLVIAPSGTTGIHTYTYTATEDKTIAISPKIGQNNVEIYFTGEGLLSQIDYDVNGDTRVLTGTATGKKTLEQPILEGDIIESIVNEGNTRIQLNRADGTYKLVYFFELPYTCEFEVPSFNIYTSNSAPYTITVRHPGVKELVNDTSRIVGDTLAPGVKKAVTSEALAKGLAEMLPITKSAKAPVATSANYALKGNGLSVANSDSQLRKYSVAPGDVIYLSLSKDNDGVYQFQSAANVSESSIAALIGTPVNNAAEGLVVVPSGATYLIVSELKTNATNAVYNVEFAGETVAPSYVTDERDRVYSLLIDRSKADVHIAAFNTDQHFDLDRIGNGGSYDPKWVMQGVASLLSIANSLPIDQVVFGGDVAGYGGVDSADVDGILKTVAYLLQPTHDTNSVIVSIPGNHEAYQNNANVTAQGMHNVNAKRNERHPYFKGNGTDNCDAYWDDEAHKIRSIYVDTYSQNGRTEDFRTFLTTALSTLPAGYNALVFSHNPLTNEFAGTVLAQKMSDASNTIDAFQNPSDCHSILDQYAERIIACINGHTHFDASALSPSGILYVETTTAAPHTRNYTTDNIPNTSTLGTVTDTSFDFFVIDQSAKTIEAVRYGEGCNRKWIYKGANSGMMDGYPQTIVR